MAMGVFLSWPGVLFVALLPNQTTDHVAMTETQMAGMEAEVHVEEVREREAELQQG